MPLPTRAAWLALAILLGLRCFFFAFPDAFIAYPEKMREHIFYRLDQQCAMSNPEPQIVIDGTSRLMPITSVPLGMKRWHTRDRVLNLSAPGNTFWHIAALLRRHPHLLDHTDLHVIDLLPLQLSNNITFSESDTLFLRESTLTEKWFVRDPLKRLNAFADILVPAWSQRHSAKNWCRALSEWPRTPAERIERLAQVQFASFTDVQSLAALIKGVESNSAQFRKRVALVEHPSEPQSIIQIRALDEIIGNRPPHGQILLIRPPFRADFDEVIRNSEAMTESKKNSQARVLAVVGDRALIEWYESPAEMQLLDEDYASDGAHFSPSGTIKLQRHIAQTYRKFYPPTPGSAPVIPPK